MVTISIQPRFNDTDALGHISNTVFPVWFEGARKAVFEIFHPSLEVGTWPLILAKTEIDFLAQTYWESEVKITTYISKLGNSSCHVIHEAWQNKKMVAKGLAVLIHYDYVANKSVSIPQNIRDKLSEHLNEK